MAWRDFLYLQRSDRRIALSLVTLLVVALAVIWHFGGSEPMKSVKSTDSTAVHRTDEPSGYFAQPAQTLRLVPFDPNTADSTVLLGLGLARWQVRSIYRFRAAGGVFQTKADFARVYKLTAAQYRRLEPYIRISPDFLPATAVVKKSPVLSLTRPPVSYPYKLRAGETVDLTTADATTLQRVPGIGPYYADKILQYGRRLGGYVSVRQLGEIENFPISTLPYFTVKPSAVRRLDVNRLSLSELRQHPYLNYYQARAIVDYRRLHGPLHSIDDLRLSPDFPDSVLVRLRPYVAFGT